MIFFQKKKSRAGAQPEERDGAMRGEGESLRPHFRRIFKRYAIMVLDEEMKDDKALVIFEDMRSKFDDFYKKMSEMYKIIHELRLSLDK